jgi:hypothetical protein
MIGPDTIATIAGYSICTAGILPRPNLLLYGDISINGVPVPEPFIFYHSQIETRSML